MRAERQTPLTLAVFTSILVLLFMTFTAVAIGGSYAVALRAIHREETVQTQLVTKQETARIEQAVPTCRAIDKMDEASHLPPLGFPAPPRNAYDKRLADAIHEVNLTSHCPLILRDITNRVPYSKIIQQLRGS